MSDCESIASDLSVGASSVHSAESLASINSLTSPRRHRRALSGITPRELKVIDSVVPLKYRQEWKKFSVHVIQDKSDFQLGFVRHVETTLGRSLFNCDDLAAYHASARSVKDSLIVMWNQTQQRQTLLGNKRIYYLSLEFLMGRAMDNALLNMGIKKTVADGLHDFGFHIEDIENQEPDAGLGNGGLGRLAACYIDSMSTLEYSAWGYGLRYEYGIFRQKIIDGYQVEQPDYWLEYSNPWEIPRHEIGIDVMFYGRVEEAFNSQGHAVKKWIGGEIVRAMAYDLPIPGYRTTNTNNLRLWSAQPNDIFDFAKFNEGDYQNAVAEQVEAETITSVLYPNDNFYKGKELRLKQQYFWVSASLSDIVRRFKKSRRDWTEFSDSAAIQLNDTHPTLAILELLRVLVDLEGLEWKKAWDITYNTFGYTNHTVMQEALEKWPLDVFGNMLPRHLEILYEVNYDFLKKVEEQFPNNPELISKVSLIEESNPKQVRMASLAVVGSHKVNGVAELHSELVRTQLFPEYVKIYGEDKFINITNGITPRRWLLEANPGLAELITEYTGGTEFLTDLTRLRQLLKHVDDPEFRSRWSRVKQTNKHALASMIRKYTGRHINVHALFDIQVKRIHEYKRQQLNVFGVIDRYLKLKKMTPEQRAKEQPRVVLIGGKSAPGYFMAKVIIKLVTAVADVVESDPEVSDVLQVVFVPDYNVSKAQRLVAANDLSEHISTAGTEASGTSNMKFVLNGGLIIGTVDGANIEIGREVGTENMFFFGHLAESVEGVRKENRDNGVSLDPNLAEVFATIDNGLFGDPNIYKPLLDSIRYQGDYYLVNADFRAFVEAQAAVDAAFADREGWVTKSITSVANMGFFSSDRAVNEYAESIWNTEPLGNDC